MPTPHKTPTTPTSTVKRAVKTAVTAAQGAVVGANDAIQLLRSDHRETEDLFQQYMDSKNGPQKKRLVGEICRALRVHTEIEEKIFYPAARKAMSETDLVDEAVVEHASAKDLVAQLEKGNVGDDLYDAKVKVLSELVGHHVKEEEAEFFPKARASGLDMHELGEQMAELKAKLMKAKH